MEHLSIAIRTTHGLLDLRFGHVEKDVLLVAGGKILAVTSPAAWS
jgi:hypothetical protein